MKNFFIKSYSRFVIMMWIIIIWLFVFQYAEMAPFEQALIFALSIFVPIIIVSSYLNNKLLPKAIANNKMGTFIVQFIIFSLLIALIHTLIFTLYEKLASAGKIGDWELYRAQSNSFIVEYLMAIPACIIINLGFCGLRFYYEHMKLQEVHLKAQLQILQQQINPHFMFNVLNHIYILMQKDIDLASNLLVKYSDILRYQLYTGKEERVALKQEIQFLQDYIEVEKMRWGNELTVKCRWDIGNSEIEIQPLLLITFVENAFKHVSRSISETGFINIIVEQRGESLYMEVENSKSLHKPKKKNAYGLGMSNIKERLGILYPKNHSLQIEETDSIYIIRLKITL